MIKLFLMTLEPAPNKRNGNSHIGFGRYSGATK